MSLRDMLQCNEALVLCDCRDSGESLVYGHAIKSKAGMADFIEQVLG